MKKKSVLIVVCLLLFACLFHVLPVSAVTEEEVRQQVTSQGNEAVTGNIFIWFLCAVSFLKIAQKIDSFLGSLGINVGNTGGSMLSEAVIAMRTISFVKNMKGGNKSVGSSAARGSSAASPGFMSGGLAGMVGRKFNQGAAQYATDQGKGGVGGQVFNASLHKKGDYANQVISNIAKGDIAKTGIMTGEKAEKAFQSYMGYTSVAPSVSSESVNNISASGSSIHTENCIHNADSIHIMEQQNIPETNSSFSTSTDAQYIPTYTNVEIGGGRITGIETSEIYPQGIEFRMCNAEQYVPPDHGGFTTVNSVDGAKWYRQYASPTVEKTPFMDAEGRIQYRETIVNRLPPMPHRKEKI